MVPFHRDRRFFGRLMDRKVPLAEPSPLTPYTLLRPCSNVSTAYFYPECLRWATKKGVIEKNAGLTYYANGSLLPHVSTFRVERERQYHKCRAAAANTFPLFKDIDGAEFDRRTVRACARGRASPGG